MTLFSKHIVEFEQMEDPLEYEEMACEPDTHLAFEASGSERFPTFTVYLVIDKQELGQRIFQSETEAVLCIKTLYPILHKEPSVALKEFQEWSPE